MADKSDEENLNIPTNNQSENRSDEIIPTTDTDTITQNQEIENMEVHHHPDLHHKPKKWKEYFLEFLMIFLAVTLGFFAESLREHISDNANEKEYILAMIEDAETDTANFHHAIELNKSRIINLDSLANCCFDYNAAKGNDSEIYRLYRLAIIHPDFVSPTERTLSQLKNSGSMRLIRQKAAVDSIVMYDDMAKKLADQQAYYERYQNESVESSFALINFQYYNLGNVHAGVNVYSSAKLLNHDPLQLMEFGNRINVYKGVVSFYNYRLNEMDEHAVNLITSLKKEYQITE
jgi:hypothetical protein